ncbi:RCC1/BLIP-II [Xylaria intraflava]|nr:RCC1/BLIP-II [Xylaria intraflava]
MAPKRKPAAAKGTAAPSKAAKSTSVPRTKVTKPAASKGAKAAAPKATKASASKAATSAATKTASKAAPKTAAKSTAAKNTTAAKKTTAAKNTAAAAKKSTAAKKPAKKSTATKSTKNANGKRPLEDDDEEEDEIAHSAGPKKKARVAATKNTRGKRPAEDEGDNDDDAPPASSTSQPKKKARVTASKRTAEHEEGDNEDDAHAASSAAPEKKARVAATKEGPTGWRKQVMLKRQKKTVVENPVPKTVLDVFVFGEGSAGELGLGSKKHDGKRPIDVKRPRLNHNLDAAKVGVVDIACGGMHAIALTHDNRVLTWGVNDDKALGRDTTWSAALRDADKDDSDSDDDDDTGINPLESTPAQVQGGDLTSSDIICKVDACDSASFILTTDGFVFGWGTFRGADGIIGFSEDVRVQTTPVLIEPLQDITNIACGSNHVVALDVHGKVWTWGNGGQFQLGRKPLTRRGGPTATLRPQPCGKFGKKHYAVNIGAGSYHSFYIDNQQRVWSWGLNNYSQTGQSDDTGKDDAMVLQPKVVKSLQDAKVEMITGGEHHSVARTADGRLLTWGRVDGHQVGHSEVALKGANTMFDENNRPRIVLDPTPVPDIDAKFVAAGTDTSFAIDARGRLFSWGFSANYQTGQGTMEDVEVPTVIDNTAIRDREMVWAGAGGQFSMAAAEHGPDSPAVAGG